MSIYIECLNRKLFLNALLDRTPNRVVLDFSYKESMKHLGVFQDVLLVYRDKKLVDKDKRQGLLKSFVDFCVKNQEFLSIVELPSEVGQELLTRLEQCSFDLMYTVTDLSFDLIQVLNNYTFIAMSSAFSITEIKEYLTKYRAYLKSFKTRVHVFSKYSKELLNTGLTNTYSTSMWTSGVKQGVTFDYVGNFKMSVFHGSKGQGKSVRKKFKSRCLQYNIDYSLLIADDNHAVNCWNLQQYLRLDLDLTKRSQLSYTQEDGASTVNEEKDVYSLVQTKNNKTSIAEYDQTKTYSRNCNSCFLSDTCPVFSVDSMCSVNTRPNLNTHNDYKSLLDSVIELQSERVFFAAYAEKTQNAGLNPEVSQEIEKLTSVMKDAKTILSSPESEVTIRAKGSGIISQIFGTYGRAGGGSKPSQSEKIIDVSPMESDDE